MSGQRMSPWLQQLMLAMLMSAPLAEQSTCSAGKELSLTMAYTINATGHPSVSAILEQPLGSPGWRMSVEVGTSRCGADGAPRRSLALTLNGPPEGGLLFPAPSSSPAPSPSPSPAPSSAPPGYLTLPGLGHYRSPPEAKNWFEASRVCRKEGGALVAPTSRHEVELLFSHFSPNATGSYSDMVFWHSANDIQEKGKFVTENGVPLENTGFAVFATGRPTNDNSVTCLRFYDDGELSDGNCNAILSFICKVSL